MPEKLLSVANDEFQLLYQPILNAIYIFYPSPKRHVNINKYAL